MNLKAMLGQGLFVLIFFPVAAYVLEASNTVGAGVGGALFAFGFCLGGAMVMTAAVLAVLRAAVRDPRR